ncbi:TetR family transcriptional regulator [Kordiimonas sp.]|uniref:TetR family transcriptional regulator n=1 Tax=Kordiimonas sp. TaxID=1970157 RepID=UPI003A910659
MKPRTPKKLPTQARAIERRDKILSAAETLLLEGGPLAVTTTSIAQTAGIPVGSIYQYFEDKNDVISTLYDTAYGEVENEVVAALTTIKPGLGFKDTHEQLIRAFWQAARAHKTFRPLTRWANSQRSLWDVTPGPESSLGQLVIKTLEIAGVTLPANRHDVMMLTAVTTLSVLIDQAIEEDDEAVADALIEEISILLTGYIG